MKPDEQRYPADKRLQRAHVQLMQVPKLRFFGSLATFGKVELATNVSTAATDGINTFYNSDFIQTLDDKELLFVVIHECMHKAYKHLIIWKHLRAKNPLLANMATDYVINLKIRDIDPQEKYIRLPTYKDGEKKGQPACLIDDNFKEMNTNEVFIILEKENNDNQNPRPEKENEVGDSGEGKSGGGESGEKDKPEKSEEDDSQGDEYSDKIKKRAEDAHDEHNYDETQRTEEEVKKIDNELDRAIRQATEVAGKGGAQTSREFSDLLRVETPWEEILAEFIKQQVTGDSESTWRQFNRRLIGSDIYMPSMLDEQAGSMVVAIDTSGSISQDIVTKFLSELKAIVTDVVPEKLHLMYWDSQICREEAYTEMDYADLENSTKPRGGGGTNPACVQKRITDGVKTGEYQNLDAVIIFTDGYFYNEGEWEKVGIPVLWAVLKEGGDPSFQPKFGSLIKVH
jgi:predicted metal-dependent peptidase